MRARGGRSFWKDWLPDTGMEGQVGIIFKVALYDNKKIIFYSTFFKVVHRWIPNHRDPSKRSHVDKTILLIKIEDRYVPIAEGGVQDLGAEV